MIILSQTKSPYFCRTHRWLSDILQFSKCGNPNAILAHHNLDGLYKPFMMILGMVYGWFTTLYVSFLPANVHGFFWKQGVAHPAVLGEDPICQQHWEDLWGEGDERVSSLGPCKPPGLVMNMEVFRRQQSTPIQSPGEIPLGVARTEGCRIFPESIR